MAQKIKKILITFFAAFILLAPAATASAAQEASGAGVAADSSTSETCNDTENANGSINQGKVNECVKANPIVKDIQGGVDFLSALVGIVVVAAIIVGGIQYSMAGDNPQALTAAKKRITDGLIALFAFLLMFAFVQWLIPGGVF